MAHKRKFVLESSDDEEESFQERQYCYQEREKRTMTMQNFDQVIEEEFAEEEEDPAEIVEEETEQEEEESKRFHIQQPDLNQDQNQNGKGSEEEEEELKGRTKKRLWRLWNVDDEIKVLEGLIEFHKLNGNGGCGYTSGFYKFIKDLIQISINRKQLQNKIKRLRKKYLDNKEKVKAGQDLVASFTDNEKKSFLLSEKIWGDQEIEQEDENGSFGRGEDDFWYRFPRLDESLKLEQFSDFTLPGTGINFVRKRLSCIGDSKAKELEEKWRELQVAETRVKLMKARLILQQTEVILNAIS